jgi:putative peptidoglycan lipid II flippase
LTIAKELSTSKRGERLLITFISLIGSGLSFFVSLGFARKYGVSIHYDAYLYALSTPTFVAALIGSLLTYGIVPVIAAEKEDGVLVPSLIVAMAAVSIAFMVPLFFIGEASRQFQQNLNQAYPAIGTVLRLSWLIGALQVFLFMSNAIYHSKGKYIVPSTLSLLPYVGTLIAVITPQARNTPAIPIAGMLIGLVIAIGFSAWRLREYFTILSRVRVADIAKVISGNAGFLSTILAVNTFSVVAIVDAQLAPRYGEGALSLLGYAQRIIVGLGNISTIGIFTVSGTTFASELKSNGIREFRKTVFQTLRSVAMISGIAAAILLILRLQAVMLIFGTGLEESQRKKLTDLMLVMIPGMIPMLVSTVGLRALMCLKDTKMAALAFGITWPLAYTVLISLLDGKQIKGFGLSYTISWTICLLILLVALHRQTRRPSHEMH